MPCWSLLGLSSGARACAREAKWLDDLAGRGLAPRGVVARVPATVARLLWSTTRTGCTPLRRGRPPAPGVLRRRPLRPPRPAARGIVDVLAPPPERPPAPPYARAWRDLCDPGWRRHRAAVNLPAVWGCLHSL